MRGGTNESLLSLSEALPVSAVPMTHESRFIKKILICEDSKNSLWFHPLLIINLVVLLLCRVPRRNLLEYLAQGQRSNIRFLRSVVDRANLANLVVLAKLKFPGWSNKF